MSEKELNKNYIRGIVEASNGNKELLINEIQELCSKEYQKGLEQGKFDATMDAQQEIEKSIEAEKNATTAMVLINEENKKLKEKNELEFNDFVKFRKEQEDRHLEKTNKLIKENHHLKQARNKAIGIAEQYAQIDGEHHKMWVIDQMLRELLGNSYDAWLEDYNQYSEENDYAKWDCGIAP